MRKLSRVLFVFSLMLSLGAHAGPGAVDEVVRLLQERSGRVVFQLSAGEFSFQAHDPTKPMPLSLSQWVASGRATPRPDLDVTLPSLVPSALRAFQLADEIVCYHLENLLSRTTGKLNPQECYVISGGIPAPGD